MAYGKGQFKDAEKRMVDLGRAMNSAELALLRTRYIAACGDLAASVWPASILDDIPSGRDLDAVMLRTQASMKGVLNSVWAEKARLAAKSAVREQVLRARGNLFGRFRHLSTTGDQAMSDGVQRLVNFPEEWSRRLTAIDIAAMQEVANSMDYGGTMDLFRKLEAGQPVCCFTPAQADALRAMLDVVKRRYGCPAWNADQGVAQLHLDFRCLSGGRAAQDALLGRLTEAARGCMQGETAGPTALLVSGVIARAAPLKLTATLRSDVLKRLMEPLTDDTDVRFTSLALEIGPVETVVRGVLTQRPRPFGLDEAECLLGNDFGYVNTSAAVLVAIDCPLDAEWLRSVQDWTRQQAREYLETHWHDGEPVQQILFEGRHFLEAINEHARHVDRLRSEIDRTYNRLQRIKREVNRILGHPQETLVDLALDPGDNRRLADLLARFAKLLEGVSRLKLLRRQIYRTVAGVKKSWFGWVSTRLVRMCRAYKAAYVRENLSVVAKEKQTPDYKGRTFNRMLNNGARGQFVRRASAKLKWWGVPEVVVPSYYTSTTDVRNAVVDARQRSGEMFKARADGWRMQADLHAGLTLALWPLLRPRAELAQAAQ